MPRNPVKDEAFAWIGEVIGACLGAEAVVSDDDAGVRMWASELTIATPVELDVRGTDEKGEGGEGGVTIACAPPLYRLDLTIQPVFHQLSFTAVAEPPRGGGGG